MTIPLAALSGHGYWWIVLGIVADDGIAIAGQDAAGVAHTNGRFGVGGGHVVLIILRSHRGFDVFGPREILQ